MKRITKTLISAVLTVIISTGIFASIWPDFTTASAATATYGFTVDSNGTLLLNSKAFYGMGVNLFDRFPKHYDDPEFDSGPSFKKLSDAGIPFVRCIFGGFYPNQMKAFIYDREAFFQAMDNVVSSAEKHNVGLIPSLIWNYNAFPDIVGESCNQIGNTSSKTVKIAKEYVNAVVTRYKDSPAIWGWEIGNEYNLGADLGGVSSNGANLPGIHPHLGTASVRTSADYITTAMVRTFYTALATEIRSIDSKRLIVGGDSEQRGSSKSLRERNSWYPVDTYNDTKESMSLYSPSPMNAISVHMYQYGSPSNTALYDFETKMRNLMSISKEIKRTLWVGEFGPGDWIGSGIANEKNAYNAIYNAILNNNVQISAPWICIYDFGDGGTDISNSSSKDYYMYEAVVNANKSYRSSGKQSTSDYWAGSSKKFAGFVPSDNYNLFGAAVNPNMLTMLTTDQSQLRTLWWWRPDNSDAEYSVVASTLADGSTGKVIKMDNKNGSSTFMKFAKIRNLKPGKKYKFSFYIKTVGVGSGGDIGFGTSISAGSSTLVSFPKISDSSIGRDKWTKFEKEFTAPNGSTNNIDAIFSLTATGGQVYLYDISLREVGASTGSNPSGNTSSQSNISSNQSGNTTSADNTTSTPSNTSGEQSSDDQIGTSSGSLENSESKSKLEELVNDAISDSNNNGLKIIICIIALIIIAGGVSAVLIIKTRKKKQPVTGSEMAENNNPDN